MNSEPDIKEGEAPKEAPPADAQLPRHHSAMRTRFGWLPELVGRYLFSSVVIHEGAAEKIRSLAARGTIVYVVRHRSFVDYFCLSCHSCFYEAMHRGNNPEINTCC